MRYPLNFEKRSSVCSGHITALRTKDTKKTQNGNTTIWGALVPQVRIPAVQNISSTQSPLFTETEANFIMTNGHETKIENASDRQYHFGSPPDVCYSHERDNLGRRHKQVERTASERMLLALATPGKALCKKGRHSSENSSMAWGKVVR